MSVVHSFSGVLCLSIESNSPDAWHHTPELREGRGYKAQMESSPQLPPPDSFQALGLSEPLLRSVAEVGYKVPTPIQIAAIPPLLAGKDLIGQAQTGTGKTAAFGLPLLQAIDPAQRSIQALVLTPTRELAIQVAEALHSYGKNLQGLVVLPVYGGHPGDQTRRRGVHSGGWGEGRRRGVRCGSACYPFVR
jgi:superfamily II DNA/RNA helicase